MTSESKPVKIINVAGDEAYNIDVRLAQLDRAFGYGPKGRGFESSNARFYMRLQKVLEKPESFEKSKDSGFSCMSLPRLRSHF